MQRLMFILFCGALLGGAQADENYCADAASAARQQACVAIARIDPDFTVVSADAGDLDGDGVVDVVYVAYRLDPRAYVVGTLRGLKGGKFAPWVQTKKLSPDHFMPVASIRNGAIFLLLTRINMNDGTASEVQYQWRDGHFCRIAMEEDFRSPLAADKPGPRNIVHVSTNYLTGQMVRTVDKDGVVTRVAEKLPVKKLEFLRDYEGQ